MTRRPGFALLYSVLMVMALSVVGVGVLALGTRETAIAIEVRRQATARALAEAAALELVGSWSTRAYSMIPIGAETPGPHPQGARTTVTRLDSALYLVTATVAGAAPGTTTAPTRASAALIVRTLDPTALAAAFPGAISATRSIDVTAGMVLAAGGCDGDAAALVAPDVAVTAGAVVVGVPPVDPSPPPPLATPDPFGPALAPALATLTHRSPTARPRPVTAMGECLPGGRNWGAIDPGHPCHGLLPLIHARGPLTVAGGTGRGILVVDGDVRFAEGARFHGIVVAGGTVELTEDSRVVGAVRADHVLLDDAEVQRDGCALVAAVSAPALDRAFRPPERWWVPVH